MTVAMFVWSVMALCTMASHFTQATGPLPLIQITHDDLPDDDYPEMKEQVHLEDFFWTGSGDGPPDFLKKVHTGISKGKEVIVKTETVVATVYVDGNNEIDIPICLDCKPDDGGAGGTWGMDGGVAPPLNYTATDRRYWLLTVMSGFYSQKDNPMLEEKLARLYRLAFTRQQSKHLGFNGSQQIAGIAVSPRGRGRRGGEQREFASTPDPLPEPSATSERAPDEDAELLDLADGLVTERHSMNSHSELFPSSEEEEDDSSTATTTTEIPYFPPTRRRRVTPTPETWELFQQGRKNEKLEALPPPPRPSQRMQADLPMWRNQQVRVVIHNITQVTEDDVQKGNVGGIYDDDVNEKIDERPVANQTELIYTVFVNGRPVLATTAAKDMSYVSENEVAEMIGKPIYMKAEPYLREPQATPLAPATRSGSVGFIDSIQNNPALVVVSSLAILLLLLLLVALLLMGRSKKKTTETQRNVLLETNRSSGPALDTGRSSLQSREAGVQNFSYEEDTERREPRIHFPGPPAQRSSRRSSLTSSDNTSDSSVYCPINPPSADVQAFLDDKAANLFERHKKRRHHHQGHHQYDQAEGHEELDAYTSVAGEKKHDKQRHKKRRYLSENRVGSLETSPTQRSMNSSGDEEHPGKLDAMYENFERPEAFNPHNHYHRNKLLQQRSIYPSDDVQAHEAINKEIIRALKPTERSSDTGSIGSFLSMSSVKAFPKSSHPEPLNRVLDPVFVTYYDNVDEGSAPGSVAKSGKTQRKPHREAGDNTTIATIESLPSPKAPNFKANSRRAASHSDNPDPGVIGPVVWERHKKQMSQDGDTDDDVVFERPTHSDNYSPARDPAAIRNHYEGLLEGAIQMYASQDDLPMPLPTRDFTSSRKPTKKEFRGSSAGLPSHSGKAYQGDGRPATAQPDKTPKSNHSTLPPSPSSGAWGGSLHGSSSPLVRPLSAGPFHRPEPMRHSSQPSMESSASASRPDLSAAPIIEAIQNELRKFKRESH